jgi:transposase
MRCGSCDSRSHNRFFPSFIVSPRISHGAQVGIRRLRYPEWRRTRARLLKAGGVATSPDTLLRLAKVQRGEPQAVPRVIGVDDFAFRRGHTSGAIIVDLLTHRPVELLADRSAKTFARWLESHPGVEWISRDRSKEFARGARLGAPQAQPILDRWHVLLNMREVVERALNRLHPRLSRLSGEPESAVPHCASDVRAPNGRAQREPGRGV